ncbi:hypothetical protein EV421DRAFT_1744671 [Armillaria borealis]|uniref:Uncharacterized protein n=1 Tax=Armillaria borealis TaxID=47425 RepID=A0AA39MDY1_9AGAR|nr:hypothetical protein EV421DRAFT_1744671 [Armillaria borealis]
MSNTLENGGNKKMAPVGVAVEREWRDVCRDGARTLNTAWAMMTSSWGKMDGTIVSSTLENEGNKTMAPVGPGPFGGASAMTAASTGETVSTIVFCTVESGGEETTAPVGAVVEWFMGGALTTTTTLLRVTGGAMASRTLEYGATIVASWMEMVGTVIGGTLKIGGEEMMVQVGAVVECRWGKAHGRCVSDDGGVAGETDSAIVSGTFENKGVEKMVPLSACS